MPVPIDSVTTAFLALGWVLTSSMAVQIFAVAVRACGRGIWRRGVSRRAAFSLALVVYAVVVTWASVVGYRNTRVDWREVAIIFSPLLITPVVAFIGHWAWTPDESGPRRTPSAS